MSVAAEEESIDCVRVLLEAGADLNCVDEVRLRSGFVISY